MGSLSNLIFSITSNYITGVNSRIILIFPVYYPPTFGSVKPHCLINSVYTRCDFTQIRTLEVRDIPLTISAGTTFQL